MVGKNWKAAAEWLIIMLNGSFHLLHDFQSNILTEILITGFEIKMVRSPEVEMGQIFFIEYF